MRNSQNGQSNTNGDGHHGHPWTAETLIAKSISPPQKEGVSGRRFVLLGVVGLLLAWGAVYLGFRAWKANYEALAEYGETQIAPLVDPLAEIIPPGVSADTWRKAVADTHAMLVALTGSGLLQRPKMDELRDEIKQFVGRSTSTRARDELSKFWDTLERRAGPVISSDVTAARPGSRYEKRHPRPPRPEILKRTN